MISIIIPTVYKAPQLPQLLLNLENCDLVTEIILVENAPPNGILDNINYSNKLIVKPYTENLFCNGAWNYGTQVCKNHYYAFCNDDVLFPNVIIKDVINFYKSRPNSGFIGMHPCQFDSLKDRPLIYGFIEREDWHMRGGWGTLIFNHKDNDIIIPNDLKQWCGDTYYIFYSKYPCYDYFGEKFYTNHLQHSTSTTNDIIDICHNDQYVFEQKYILKKPIWKK